MASASASAQTPGKEVNLDSQSSDTSDTSLGAASALNGPPPQALQPQESPDGTDPPKRSETNGDIKEPTMLNTISDSTSSNVDNVSPLGPPPPPLAGPDQGQLGTQDATGQDSSSLEPTTIANKVADKNKRLEEIQTFCLKVTQDANADLATSSRAQEFLESQSEKSKVSAELAKALEQVEQLKAQEAEVSKRIKFQAKQISAEKMTQDLGYLRIRTPISDEEMDRLCRDKYLSLPADPENGILAEECSPAQWIVEHLGKDFGITRQGRNAKVTLEKKHEQLLLDFFNAFAAHFAEIKDWMKKITCSVNEMISHHNKSVDTKRDEIKKPSYAKAVAAGPLDQKKVVKIASKEVERQLHAKRVADEKHSLQREKTIRQILGVRIPEVPGISSVTDKSKAASLEADNFVKFTNDLLKDPNKKSNKKLLHLNQIESIRRVDWPHDHKGVNLRWDRRLHVTLKPGCEQATFDIIQAQNQLCAKRNKEIADGVRPEQDRIYRHLQVQLTEHQRKEQVKLQTWCHRTNAMNREADKNCKLWFVFYREDGTPFKRLIVDRHPQRIAELEYHWQRYKAGGPKHKSSGSAMRQAKKGRPLAANSTHRVNDLATNSEQPFQVVSRKRSKRFYVTEEERAILEQAKARRMGEPIQLAAHAMDFRSAQQVYQPFANLGASGYGPPPAIFIPPPPLPTLPAGPPPTPHPAGTQQAAPDTNGQPSEEFAPVTDAQNKA